MTYHFHNCAEAVYSTNAQFGPVLQRPKEHSSVHKKTKLSLVKPLLFFKEGRQQLQYQWARTVNVVIPYWRKHTGRRSLRPQHLSGFERLCGWRSVLWAQLSRVNLQKNLQGNCIANIKFAKREILSEAMLVCGNLLDFQVQPHSTGKSCSSFYMGCYAGPAANYFGPVINI